MSLGIAFKGPEGIVLAADSRVTLTAEVQDGQRTLLLPSTFDNATKLLSLEVQRYVGVVTYGAGTIGVQQPRTPQSYLPEFERDLYKKVGDTRLPVEVFAADLAAFFVERWKEAMPGDYVGPAMTFLVGGFDEDSPYGRVFKADIPYQPNPQEQHPDDFGVTWGGQLEFTTRLILGYDPRLLHLLQSVLNLSDEQRDQVQAHLTGLEAKIPYQFLPLQDCVDMSIFLIGTTMQLQQWMVGVRGVGGGNRCRHHHAYRRFPGCSTQVHQRTALAHIIHDYRQPALLLGKSVLKWAGCAAKVRVAGGARALWSA